LGATDRRRADDVRAGQFEHCRHKIFNAQYIVDGVRQPRTFLA
jgi:hypothetical protein